MEFIESEEEEEIFTIVDEHNNNMFCNRDGQSLVHNNETEGCCNVDYTEKYKVQNDNEESASTKEFTKAATKLLLHLYLERNNKFRNKTIKKKTMWKEIEEEMKMRNYSFTEMEIERKFRNLKIHFINIKDNNTKTGRGRVTWAFYSIMEKIFEKDACVNPAPCVSSMPIQGPSTSTGINKLPSRYDKVKPLQSDSGTSKGEKMNREKLPSGYYIVKQIHPETGMVEENATSQVVKEAKMRKRLQKSKVREEETEENSHIKRVRKSQPASTDLVNLQKQQNVELQTSINAHNNIQQQRNDLLKAILDKLH